MSLLLLSLLACNAEKDATPDTASTPSYNADVAPILRENCEVCHSAGQVGPFPLNSYEEVTVIGEAVADSVETRRMPPWLADPSCNSYEDSRWLSEAEIATIRAWVDGGMPEGDPAAALEPYAPPDGHLSGATHSVAIPTPYAPDFEAAEDDYRCFLVNPELESDGYVTGFEIIPGDPEIVHHLILYLPSSVQAVQQASQLDDQDPDPGYSCFGDARVDSSMIAAWAPGSWTSEYPEGTGIAIPAGRPVVIQMHYNDAGGPEPSDATEVLLRVEPEVESELYSFFWVNGNLRIPPGVEDHLEEVTRRVSSYVGDVGGDLLLHEIGPHMHTLGRSLNSTLVRADGSETCLLDVPRWDFNWQMSYTFTDPVRLGMDDLVRLGCSYDSTDRSDTTTWGDGTSDEMCLTTMFVTIDAE
ncbi:MAG: hypothetical protein H6741_09895 [Alphaproteobacteria bacterium]|nr:hypothetical protein [Alphaproteobacteria bacterium]MCB9793024.1 hypothetical protein [Alphaproteobacteria bacterium]